jgi:hypothetical protein
MCAGMFRDRNGSDPVIGKVLRGRNVRRLLQYLYGPGQANVHTDPHLVAGFGDPAELEPERRPDGTRDLRRLTGLLEQPLAAVAGPGYDQPVWHCAIRGGPGGSGVIGCEVGPGRRAGPPPIARPGHRLPGRARSGVSPVQRHRPAADRVRGQCRGARGDSPIFPI